MNQKVLSRMLSRAGITNLTIVDNGKKAVDLTENEQFDIIFMDIQVWVVLCRKRKRKSIDSAVGTSLFPLFFFFFIRFLQMPVMDGMQATKIITERNPLEKVIFCTAHALDEFKEQTEAVGATHFISKPFQLDEINNVFKGLGY